MFVVFFSLGKAIRCPMKDDRKMMKNGSISDVLFKNLLFGGLITPFEMYLVKFQSFPPCRM